MIRLSVGHQRPADVGESLLIELHAVSNAEVPFAIPRHPTRGTDAVRGDVRAILDLFDEQLR